MGLQWDPYGRSIKVGGREMGRINEIWAGCFGGRGGRQMGLEVSMACVGGVARKVKTNRFRRYVRRRSNN